MRQSLTIDGHRVSYLERASLPEAGAPGSTRETSQTLVLLHAFPFSADMWAPQFAGLPPGWRLIAPDFRGFGESDADRGDLMGAGLRLDDYARDTLALLDRLEVRAAAFAGLSLGGYVAFAMLRLMRASSRPVGSPAWRWPVVTALVLADTRAQADTPEGRAGRLRLIGTLKRDGVASLADDMIPKLVDQATVRRRPDVLERLRTWIGAARPEAVEGALWRMMARPDSTPQLAQIACPTSIVVGEHDQLTPVDLSRDMQARIPNATLEIVPSAGHMTNLERPEAFNAALTTLLSRV